MNLKFFILGLCVLVSIVQVRSNGIENGEMNGKPDQFNLMELFSHKKRNILSDLFELKADESDELTRSKRSEPKSTTEKEEILGRRFNPLDAIKNVASQPMKLALTQAMKKLFDTYTDTSKPFGPTYDTTWGSPPPPPKKKSGRKMNTAADYARTPSSGAPGDQGFQDQGQTPTIVQPTADPYGYYNYYMQMKQPAQHNTQTYEPNYRSLGHSLEPALPYQANYDNNINGRVSVFTSPFPGYFPKYQNMQPYDLQNRRSGSEDVSSKILNSMKQMPKEIQKVLEKIRNAKNSAASADVSSRRGYLGDVYQKRPAYGDYTQMEFKGSKGDAMKENRRNLVNNNFDFDDLLDKLVESTLKGFGIIGAYLSELFENGNAQEIGERLLSFFGLAKKVKAYFASF